MKYSDVSNEANGYVVGTLPTNTSIGGRLNIIISLTILENTLRHLKRNLILAGARYFRNAGMQGGGVIRSSTLFDTKRCTD